MAFANPQALWLLLLLPIPLLLSRRRTTRRHGVSNLFLWKASLDPDAPTLTFRSPRRHWLLALQMGIIGAIAVAVARPVIPSRTQHVALVLDLSASMSAREGSRTRFDAARERAMSVVGRLPGLSRVRLIAAGTSARDVGEYAASDAALARAIGQIAPAAGTADIPGAIEIARRTATGERIVIVSDHAIDTRQSSEVPIEWETVGDAADNVAISTFVVRRQRLSASDGDALVGIRNYSARRTRADVELSQDGHVIARRSTTIDKDGEQTIVVRVPQVGRVMTARLIGSDALPVDDSRMDIVPPAVRIRVALAGRRNFYIERALAANPMIAITTSAVDADVVVCGCDRLPTAGNALMLPDSNPPSDARVLSVVKPDHAIASELSFADAVASPTPGIVNGEVVVRAGDVPAVVASERDGRRIVELRFEPAPENAVNTAFPILIANAVRWLDGTRDNATQLDSGEPLRWTVPDARNPLVTGPDGKTRAAQVSGRTLTVVDTAQPGLYTVRTGDAERRFAVNARIDGESDLRKTSSGRNSPPAAGHAAANDRPLTRVLLLFAAVLVGGEWLVARRGTAWRVAIAACLLLGATGFAVVPRTAPLDVVAVVDRSRSVPLRAQQEAMTRLTASVSTMRRGDRLGIVDVGADALVAAELSETPPPRSARSAVADGDTDIAAGLRIARAMLPREGARRIVLFSDGRETIGDAEREAAFLAADGVRIDVSRVDTSARLGTPAVVRVAAPGYARSNEPFAVTVEIAGKPGARAQMTIYRDEQEVDTEEILVGASGTTIETLTDKQPAGIHVYRAATRSDDGEDMGTGAVVSVSGEPSLLYVSHSPGVLQPVFAAAGFHLTRVAPDAMPRGSESLLPYDAVVLDDVSADELGAARASDVARYVEQLGGGLLVLGGARTLDVGGYPIGPLGQGLPVDFRPRSGQRSPSFGLVLVFDKSGSMADQAGGASKIELARQAVMRVLDVLPSTDALGVIAFDANPRVVTPFAPGQRAVDVARQLQTIVPGGPTKIAAAAALAARWLNDGAAQATISKRRILLISDGQTSAEDEQQLRAAIAGARVEVSAVAIGNAANRPLLQQLASSTGGRAYFPSDLAELPKIVAREAARSRSGQVVEEPFVVRSAPHAVMAGIERSTLPMLSGYVVGAAKPSASSILTSHLDDPILCAWRFGLGRVAVFTADLESSWSAQLRAWRGFGRLWAQTARWVSRGLDDRDVRLTSVQEGKTLRFVVSGVGEDGRALDLTDVTATLRSPDDKAVDVTFAASAPGQYVAHVDASAPGAYTLSLSARDRDSGADHHVFAGVFRGDDQERALAGPDDELLRRLASATGGRVLAQSDGPFGGPRPTVYREVSTWIAGVALALYLIQLVLGASLHGFVARRWRTTRPPLTSSAA